jgi:hypothetical protein
MKGNEMAVEIASSGRLAPAELDERRLAVESAIGSLRIESLELDSVSRQILERYASGEIPIDEMSRLIHEHSASMR